MATRILKHVPPIEARAVILSLVVGFLLLLVKFIAFFVTRSSAIFADAIEGFVNVSASAFAIYALVLAHRPADKEHPYGHGKIEFFSAAFEGGMILLAAVVSIAKAAKTIWYHEQVHLDQVALGVVLILSAMVVNGAIGWNLIRTGRKVSSITLEADGWHLITDAVTSAFAAAAVGLVYFFQWAPADPLMAIAVSFYIAWTGVKLLRRSAAGLMDEQDTGDTKTIRDILDGHVGPTGESPQICGYHKLRHRHSGRYHWVDFHIKLPGKTDVATAHTVASKIEYQIEQALVEGDATAHVEPCDDPDCKICPPVATGAANSFATGGS
jgi:cation diffusion facilitator family transporter